MDLIVHRLTVLKLNLYASNRVIYGVKLNMRKVNKDLTFDIHISYCPKGIHYSQFILITTNGIFLRAHLRAISLRMHRSFV